jgi:hypothetical protein
MHNIIETIEHGFNYPVDSRVKAVEAYNIDARNGHYTNSYGHTLRGILGIDCQELENEDHARIQIAYVIDLAVGAHLSNEEIDPNKLYVEATKRARDFARDEPWHFAKKPEEVKLDSEGRPKPKKGSKGERSYEVYCELVEKGASRKEIIEAFQDEEVMGMTPHTKSGATTYFYNMKKKYEASL